MDLLFSQSAHAFFSRELHGDAVPTDAVSVTPEDHRTLLEGQSQGRTIIAGENGYPCLAKVSKPTVAETRAALVRRVKREAARRIEAIAPIWRQINDQRIATPEGAARFIAIDTVRAASSAIEAEIETGTAKDLKAIDLANHPLWPAE
ncbi:hypothetical protein [Sphingobium sp.]|uniref:hypothetical protein n=1 Tax=Sphingobium sp. TaxID=1912891 RepID=UPI0028BF5A38|nr:hypothetical protein [Sphingobium sp.]